MDVRFSLRACIEALFMPSTCLRLQSLTAILATLVLIGLQSQFPTHLSAQTKAPKQHFACNTGYTKQGCQAATAILRNALARYPVDALGQWTWVLVRTADWKYLLPEKGINLNVPAFSNLTKGVTFLDGSLVDGLSIRATELRLVWHMPIEELLDLTIRHELAHALCNERSELKTNRIARTLKDGAPLSCRATPSDSNLLPKGAPPARRPSNLPIPGLPVAMENVYLVSVSAPCVEARPGVGSYPSGSGWRTRLFR